MTETTSTTEELSREEFAAYLKQLSEEFGGEDEVNIEIGNKTVRVQPPTQINCDTSVTEKSGGMLSNERETIEISVSWQPES